jgi:ParB/RepB/Spo0J family partition protein
MNVSRAEQIEKSMRLHGQLQPIVVRSHEGGYQVIDGHKRVYVAMDMMMSALECYILDVDEQQAKILLLRYNRTNQSMEVWEEAMVLKDLLKEGDLDQRQLAKLVGHSPSWVSRRLSLISKVDEQVASEIRMGTLTSSHARALIRLPRGNQIDVARVISTYHLSSRLSDRLVSAFLEAEDADQQRQILTHPEHIIWDQRDLPEEPYDARLSDYGNELMHAVMHMWRPLAAVLSTLGDSRIGDLSESEKAIIYPFLGELNDLTEKILSATGELQIQKP